MEMICERARSAGKLTLLALPLPDLTQHVWPRAIIRIGDTEQKSVVTQNMEARLWPLVDRPMTCPMIRALSRCLDNWLGKCLGTSFKHPIHFYIFTRNPFTIVSLNAVSQAAVNIRAI